MDTIIAAIAEARGCTIVTDNSRDFHGISVVNPTSEGRGA